MEILTFAQTLFYLVSSIAIIIVGALLVLLFLQLIAVMRDVKNFSDTVNRASEEVRTKVSVFLEKASNFSFISSIVDKFSEKKKTKKSN